MYEAFYGLTCKPFQLNPDHGFYFSSGQHRRAKSYLEYGVMRNEGFIVITGEVGAGKTTIVRGLLDSLDAESVVAANLVTTQLDAEDTLRMVASAFGVAAKGLSKADLLTALEVFLLHQVSQGRRCLLIVDEAQNLTPQAVEELRMLSNFQLRQQALLQTFLVGQPEFRAILQSPGMLQLRQRVTASCHIGPLSQEETEGYIQHRLKCAGATDRPSFDAPAFEAIFLAAGGVPRRINMLCDRLLLLGFLEERSSFDANDVNLVVKEMLDETAGPAVLAATSSSSSQHDSTQARLAHWHGSWRTSTQSVDLQLPDEEPGSDNIVNKLDLLQADQLDGRLRRLEKTMLRLEKSHSEILALLRQMATNLQPPKPEST